MKSLGLGIVTQLLPGKHKVMSLSPSTKIKKEREKEGNEKLLLGISEDTKM